MELVSIVIPVYNAANYIENTLNSVLNQSYANIEVIAINDGSIDNSLDILNKIKENDNRLFVYTKKNEGVSIARNYGLEKSKGAYITFVDADDIIDCDLVKILVQILEKSNADISCCGYTLVRTDQEIHINGSTQKKVYNQIEALEDLVKGKNIEPSVWAKLYKRIIIKNNFVPNLKYREDFLFNVEAFLECKRVVCYDIPLYRYIMNSNSATVNPQVCKRTYDSMYVMNRTIECFDKKGFFNIVEYLKNKQIIEYIVLYNSLIDIDAVGIKETKIDLVKLIKKNRKQYSIKKIGIKNKMFYLGIMHIPKFYEWIYMFLKKIMPDRRIHKL